MTDYEEEIIRVNSLFYEAFSTANLDLMQSVWKQDADISVIHPGHAMLSGYNDVMESWKDILSASPCLEISCCNVTVFLRDDIAYIICNELLPGHTLIATNIFMHDDTGWKIIHHQAGPSPQISVTENSGSVH
jgi:hypothetical protein